MDPVFLSRLQFAAATKPYANYLAQPLFVVILPAVAGLLGLRTKVSGEEMAH